MAEVLEAPQNGAKGIGITPETDLISVGYELAKKEQLEKFSDVVSDRYHASEIELVKATTELKEVKEKLGQEKVNDLTREIKEINEKIFGCENLQELKKLQVKRGELYKRREDMQKAITKGTKDHRKTVKGIKNKVELRDAEIVRGLIELGKW